MPGFDPDQPRDEKGQWTAGDAATAIRKAAADSFNTRLMKGLPFAGVKRPGEVGSRDFSNVVAKIQDDENFMRDQPIEYASVYDEQGVVLDKITSNAHNYVQFTDEQAAQMRGKIMTHNHPAGRSFSLNDLKLAFHHGLHSIRVAGSRDWDYEFFPSKKLDLINNADDVDSFVSLYSTIEREIKNEFTNKLWNEEITEDYANYNHHHEVNKMFAEKTGSKYVRRPSPKKVMLDKMAAENERQGIKLAGILNQ